MVRRYNSPYGRFTVGDCNKTDCVDYPSCCGYCSTGTVPPLLHVTMPFLISTAAICRYEGAINVSPRSPEELPAVLCLYRALDVPTFPVLVPGFGLITSIDVYVYLDNRITVSIYQAGTGFQLAEFVYPDLLESVDSSCTWFSPLMMPENPINLFPTAQTCFVKSVGRKDSACHEHICAGCRDSNPPQTWSVTVTDPSLGSTLAFSASCIWNGLQHTSYTINHGCGTVYPITVRGPMCEWSGPLSISTGVLASAVTVKIHKEVPNVTGFINPFFVSFWDVSGNLVDAFFTVEPFATGSSSPSLSGFRMYGQNCYQIYEETFYLWESCRDIHYLLIPGNEFVRVNDVEWTSGEEYVDPCCGCDDSTYQCVQSIANNLYITPTVYLTYVTGSWTPETTICYTLGGVSTSSSNAIALIKTEAPFLQSFQGLRASFLLATDGDEAKLMVRYTDEDNYYYLIIRGGEAGTGRFQLWERSGGDNLMLMQSDPCCTVVPTGCMPVWIQFCINPEGELVAQFGEGGVETLEGPSGVNCLKYELGSTPLTGTRLAVGTGTVYNKVSYLYVMHYLTNAHCGDAGCRCVPNILKFCFDVRVISSPLATANVFFKSVPLILFWDGIWEWYEGSFTEGSETIYVRVTPNHSAACTYTIEVSFDNWQNTAATWTISGNCFPDSALEAADWQPVGATYPTYEMTPQPMTPQGCVPAVRCCESDVEEVPPMARVEISGVIEYDQQYLRDRHPAEIGSLPTSNPQCNSVNGVYYLPYAGTDGDMCLYSLEDEFLVGDCSSSTARDVIASRLSLYLSNYYASVRLTGSSVGSVGSAGSVWEFWDMFFGLSHSVTTYPISSSEIANATWTDCCLVDEIIPHGRYFLFTGASWAYTRPTRPIDWSANPLDPGEVYIGGFGCSGISWTSPTEEQTVFPCDFTASTARVTMMGCTPP